MWTWTDSENRFSTEIYKHSKLERSIKKIYIDLYDANHACF